MKISFTSQNRHFIDLLHSETTISSSYMHESEQEGDGVNSEYSIHTCSCSMHLSSNFLMFIVILTFSFKK